MEEQVKKDPDQGKRIVKLDFTISSPKQRNELVKKLIQATPPEQLTRDFLDYLGWYIINQPTKGHNINTVNRLKTIKRHETSYQGLAAQFIEGQDAMYHLFSFDGKSALLIPKISISEQDLEDIPYLRKFRQCIEKIQREMRKASGRKKFLLKKQIIQMRQDQYVIKSIFKPPANITDAVNSFNNITFYNDIKVEDGKIIDNSLISFFNPKHVSLLLCNYSKLKEESYGKFQSDAYYMMMDFDNLVQDALKEKNPIYYDLVIHKIDGCNNLQVRKLLEENFGVTYSVEYISTLWRRKIPKIITQCATKNYLIWYYTEVEKGKWKRCSRCGQIKLANNLFFSKNNTSKDGLYSICKECRNKRKKVQHRLTEEQKKQRKLEKEKK